MLFMFRGRTVPNLSVLSLAATAIAAWLSTAAALAVEPSGSIQPASFPHPVWDSHLYPEDQSYFYWVDDDTVLFRAHTTGKPRNFEEARHLKSVLYLWHIGEAPRVYAAGVDMTFLRYCAADGWIRFTQVKVDPKTGKRATVTIEGPLGHERQVAPELLDPQPVAARGNAANDPRLIDSSDKCRRPADPAMAGRWWVTDTDRRYRLDFGPVRGAAAADARVVLSAADGSRRIDLPIALKDLGGGNDRASGLAASCTQYHPFEGVFFVWDCRNVGLRADEVQRWRARDNCWPVWEVTPTDGKTTTKICLPFGDWVGGAIDLVPTKAGLFFASHTTGRNPNDPGPSGLYAFAGGTAQRVWPGVISFPVVSPSGCKVIFNYVRDQAAADYGKPGSPTVVAADVCAMREG